MTGAEVMVGAAIVSSLASVGTAIYTMSKSSPGSPDLAQTDPTLAQADAQRAEDIAAQERARRAAAGRASTMLMGGGAADEQTLGGGGQPAAQAPTATKVLLGG